MNIFRIALANIRIPAIPEESVGVGRTSHCAPTMELKGDSKLRTADAARQMPEKVAHEKLRSWYRLVIHFLASQ